MMPDGTRRFNVRDMRYDARVRHAIPALRALAWPSLVFVAARVPAIADAFPVLGIARGPLGWAALVLAAAVAIARFRARDPDAARPAPNVRPRVLLAIAAAAYVALGLWYASRLRVSGDEPHYLLMAQSLWREGDLDLADNLAREDWRENTPGPVAPHYGAPRADGRPFPAHSVGLPFVLAPVYAAGGRLLCGVAIALAGAGVTVIAARLASPETPAAEVPLEAWLFALGPPLAFYSFHVYTEAPSALAAFGALALLLAPAAEPIRRVAILRAGGAALLASALPWLHVKMIPAAAALAIVAAARLRGHALAVFACVSALAGALYLAYYHAIFGTASPLALYGGLPVGQRGSPVRALAGLLLDRSYGLLWHAPVFVLALAALPEVLRRRFWPHALLAAAILAPVLFWRMWWGGQCPPARFLVPIVPALAAFAALRVERVHGLARWRYVLVAAGFALTVFAVADPGALLLLNRADRPTRLWTALSGDTDVGRYLPTLVAADPTEDRVAIVWVLAIGALLVLDGWSRREPRVDRLFTGTGLPVALILAGGIAVDSWARSVPGSATHSSTQSNRRSP